MGFIVDYLRTPNASVDDKLKSLRDSVQIAIDGISGMRAATSSGASGSGAQASNDAVLTKGELLDALHPVGTVYRTSDSAFDPNVSWVGTWERIRGKFLLSEDDAHPAGSEGGSADAVIPYHSHSVGTVSIESSGAHTNHTMKGYGNVLKTTTSSPNAWRFGSGGSDSATGIIQGGAHTHTVPAHNTNYAGESGNAEGANMPPYLAVNTWIRVS